MAQLLLDAGPSPRGWHRLETVLRCPQLYSNLYNLKLVPDDREALVLGGLVHVGLAHHYVRMQQVQQDKDPDTYLTPLDAMRQSAVKNGKLGQAMLALAEPMLAAYAIDMQHERLTVLFVEQIYEANVRGHRFTQRLDLVFEDLAGFIWIRDHKTAADPGEITAASYTLSGQFLAMINYGVATWRERFGGVQIGFVGKSKPYTSKRVLLKPAPNAAARFAGIVQDAEDRIQSLSARDPNEYPMTASEQVCVSKYGKCAFFDRCCWGEN